MIGSRLVASADIPNRSGVQFPFPGAVVPQPIGCGRPGAEAFGGVARHARKKPSSGSSWACPVYASTTGWRSSTNPGSSGSSATVARIGVELRIAAGAVDLDGPPIRVDEDRDARAVDWVSVHLLAELGERLALGSNLERGVAPACPAWQPVDDARAPC